MLITLTYNNFKQYAQQGTVPAVEQNNSSKVPQNSFYKSVYYIDSVLGPIKDMLVGVKHDLNTSEITMGRREKVVWGTERNDCYSGFANLLLVLYTGVAYLMYLPKKLFFIFQRNRRPEISCRIFK